MATLSSTPDNDKINGGPSADSINGLAGNDTLAGFAGNDTLIGDTGNDYLNGGADNDLLLGDAGNDTLLGEAGNDSLDGGADNDSLDGGAGSDTLNGGTGADTLTGGDGNDTYFVDNIADRVIELAQSTSGKDTIISSIDYTLLVNFENLELTGPANLKGTGNPANNIITGNDSDNLLDGGDGFDTLIGGDGDDTLEGGDGSDSLIGGDGNDVYLVDNPDDHILETATGGDQDAVRTRVSYTLSNFLEILTLTGSNTLDGTGNALDNTVEGNDADNKLSGEAGNDTLLGHAGDDVLTGGRGNDEIDGGLGNDEAVYAGKQRDYQITPDKDGQTWVVKDINPNNGDEGTDRLTHIETLRFADGVITPSDTQGLPHLNADDISLTEGDSGTQIARFVLTLSTASKTIVSVDYQTADETAQAGSDYLPQTGTLSFQPGETRKTIAITVYGDIQSEPDETFLLLLSNPVGVQLETVLATATVLNDERPRLSIASTSIREGDNGLTEARVTVTLSTSVTAPVTVEYATADVTALADQDYNPASGQLSFAPGETRKTFSVFIKGDTLKEPDEKLRVLLKNPVGVILDTTAAFGYVTVTDDDSLAQPVLTLSSDKTSFKAGDTAQLTFTFSAIPQGFTASNISVSGGTLGPLSVDASRLIYTARYTPSTASDHWTGNVSVAANSYTDAAGTIGRVDNNLNFSGDTQDPNLTISSDKTTLKTGETATLIFSFSEIPTGFTYSDISLSAGTLGPLTADASGKLYTARYTPPTGMAQTTRINVAAATYTDALGNPGLAGNTLNLTVENQAVVVPTFTVTGTTVSEGNTGTTNAYITVSLSAVSSQVVTVNYTTQDGTATAGTDYQASNALLTFAPGQTSQTFSILLYGDTRFEPDETFRVNLSTPAHATLSLNSSAVVTIRNDDPQPLPTASISGITVNEGNSGTSNATVTLSLSATYNQAVTLNYATQDGTAIAGSDYTATRSTVTFNPGETSKTVSIPLLGDTQFEPDETFQVILDGAAHAILSVNNSAVVTIRNDDTLPLPTVSISGTTVNEGNSGTTNATVTVSLSASYNQPITVNYATQDGTATAGSDYAATHNTLTFAPGETRKTIAIPIFGEALIEPDETFRVNLNTPANATLSATPGAVVTIRNDDYAAPPPKVSISGTTLSEGNSGTTHATATVSLSAASSLAITVEYQTADGTATAGQDYVATRGQLTFAAGETRKTVAVDIRGDTLIEPDETVQVSLFNPQNATLGTSSAGVTIRNDDYQVGQKVIDLGSEYGKLIYPVKVDGGHWYYFWDRSGDGTSAGHDDTTHDWLDQIFNQDINGAVGGGDNTNNTYRYATINGVHVALPRQGDGRTGISGHYYANGTAVGGSPASVGSTAINPTYNDLLAVWDAYNGTGT
ncbi:MAG: Calx-beta domain-containing protein, partial [Methylococcaceae bacterium]